jgi:uncharacterized integral membrane protein (TIGR00698 family)
MIKNSELTKGASFKVKIFPENKLFKIFPGLALCLVISLAGLWLGSRIPIVGAPVFALIIGIVIGNVLNLSSVVKPGSTFCSKYLLQISIILLGGSLNLMQIWNASRESLWVMLVSLCVALFGAWLIGNKMGIDRKLTSLIGVGTGICGGSAIAAVSPIIKADDDEVAFSISTIFLFNVVAVILFPFIGHLLSLQEHSFGMWAGTAINDTSSVVAAGYSYGPAAGDFATITKLTRTTMIIPISLGFAFLTGRKSSGGKFNIKKIIPWFVLGFIAMATLNTSGILGQSFPNLAGSTGRYLIVLALAGVGLSANLAKMLKTGPKPILLGLITWALVASSSLAMQAVLHQL